MQQIAATTTCTCSALPHRPSCLPPIDVGTSPVSDAITADGAYVYVVINSTPGNVTVISTATNEVVGLPIPVGNVPLDIAIYGIPGTPSPPSNLSASSIKRNNFGTAYEFFATLHWSAPSSTQVDGYLIYLDGKLVGITSHTSFDVHNLSSHEPNVIQVKSFNSSAQSTVVQITI